MTKLPADDNRTIGFKWTKRTSTLTPKQAPPCFDDESDEESMDIGGLNVLTEPEVSQQSVRCKKFYVTNSISEEEYRTRVNRIADLSEVGNGQAALDAIEELLQTKCDEKVLDMKAQILLQLRRAYDAVKCCEISIRMNPRWWEAHQTHGRALLAFGEPDLALKAFQRAIRINPVDNELRLELNWIINRARGVNIPENADPLSFVQLRKTSCIIFPLYNW